MCVTTHFLAACMVPIPGLYCLHVMNILVGEVKGQRGNKKMNIKGITLKREKSTHTHSSAFRCYCTLTYAVLLVQDHNVDHTGTT